uniref:Uncharacterized protein n=1 Tax=Cucumis melo TaxID=3656 RepID=A0A9I9EBU1_CUCME
MDVRRRSQVKEGKVGYYVNLYGMETMSSHLAFKESVARGKGFARRQAKRLFRLLGVQCVISQRGTRWCYCGFGSCCHILMETVKTTEWTSQKTAKKIYSLGFGFGINKKNLCKSKCNGHIIHHFVSTGVTRLPLQRVSHFLFPLKRLCINFFLEHGFQLLLFCEIMRKYDILVVISLCLQDFKELRITIGETLSSEFFKNVVVLEGVLRKASFGRLLDALKALSKQILDRLGLEWVKIENLLKEGFRGFALRGLGCMVLCKESCTCDEACGHENFSHSTVVFWFKLFSKVSKLSLVYNLGLPANFEARKIGFELKKGEKVILKENLSSLDI